MTVARSFAGWRSKEVSELETCFCGKQSGVDRAVHGRIQWISVAERDSSVLECIPAIVVLETRKHYLPSSSMVSAALEKIVLEETVTED